MIIIKISFTTGMGVSLVAETNFNAMFPFVLAELSGLGRNSIATVMSIDPSAIGHHRTAVRSAFGAQSWLDI